MKYQKPELVAITAATSAIQGQGKGSSQIESFPVETVPAYEADE